MSKLREKHEEFKTQQSAYVNRRRELLKEPEEQLSAIAEDLGVHELREEVEALLKKKLSRAWRLYRKIWDGEPTIKEVDKFLELSVEIMSCDDFISEENLKMWQVTRDLVWAFKNAFKGTQDEFDQKDIVKTK